MDTRAKNILCISLSARLGVTLAAAEAALLTTIEHFQVNSHDPAVLRAGITPADYMQISLRTIHFSALLTCSALIADGRDADALLEWEEYERRTTADAQRAHQAVPASAVLGDPDAIHRVGRSVGLSDQRTDQLTAGIVRTLATGFPYRGPGQGEASLTDLLAALTAEELADLLRRAMQLSDGQADEAAAKLGHILRRTY
ncbi:hypothetical protein [Streptomyces murinus]|uniref:hypothetical protein n=1 Tax=Streptomyces murinus TaxID=33900 RepID=UPI003F46E043